MNKAKIPKFASNAEERWTPFEDATAGDPFGDRRCVINSLYQVTIDQGPEGWTWLSIVRRDRSALHDWRHLQRIKNEICGPNREALELYPAESRLVDASNQYHLFVAPEGVVLPFGYRHRDVSDRPEGAHKQRPFAEPPEDLNADPHTQTHVEVYWPSNVKEET